MAKKKFVRQDSMRYSKLGKNRKKLQKWRRPKGRDSKMRENRFGYPKVVSVGYKNNRKDRGKINGEDSVLVHNVKELGDVNNKSIIIGAIGAKKKLEVIKKAMEMKLVILNLKVAEAKK